MSGGICSNCGDAVNGYCFNCMGFVEEGMGSFYPDRSVRDYDRHNHFTEIDHIESLDALQLSALADQITSKIDDQLIDCFQSSHSSAVSYSALTTYDSMMDFFIESSEPDTLKMIKEGMSIILSEFDVNKTKIIAMPTFDQRGSIKIQKLVNDLMINPNDQPAHKFSFGQSFNNIFKKTSKSIFNQKNILKSPIEQDDLKSTKELLDLMERMSLDIPPEIILGRKLYPCIHLDLNIENHDILILGKHPPSHIHEEILIHLLAGKLIQGGARKVHCLAVMTSKDNSQGALQNKSGSSNEKAGRNKKRNKKTKNKHKNKKRRG